MKIDKKLLAIFLIASVLRVWKLDQVPPSLFGDELDVGYHAYSILKTGRDYYGNFLPIHFHSLAEWRTPLYLYSSVPTVAIFGITAWGVRLPAAMFGVLGVLAFYLLVRELNPKLKYIAPFLMAISPWHIQYSRAGFEVTELIAFLLLGTYFFFRSLKNGKGLWISALFLAFTPWIYSTAKFFTPLLIIALILLWRKEVTKLRRMELVKAATTLLVVGLPIAISTFLGSGTQRFSYIGIFSDPNLENRVGVAREFDGFQSSFLTRLILILAPLLFLISFAVSRLNRHLLWGYGILLLVSFILYQHEFWIHNPISSERWWHYGWQEAISYIKEHESEYEKVVLTTFDEPPWIFFAGHYEYPPERWQREFPIGNDIELAGFGKVSHIDKFYFGSPKVGGLYEIGKSVDSKTLYLASQKEVKVDLIMEPARTPSDLVLLKAIPFPSGDPAFYLFTGKNVGKI